MDGLPVGNQPQPKIIYSHKSKRLFLILGIPILVGIVFGILAYKKFIPVPGKSQATLLASVGERKIYLSEVQKRTEEVLVKSAINKQALQNTLDQLIEQGVLDIEAQRLNIQVTGQEIAQKVAKQKNATPSAKEREQYSTIAKYQLLKERVTQKKVESRLAYVIGFWVPSYNYPDPFTDLEKAKFEKMRKDGKAALDEAAKLLKKGDTPLSVTQHLFDKYPSLQDRLALNNLIFKFTTDQTGFNQPILYSYDENLIKKPLYKALFSMKPDEIKVIESDDGSGGSVIQLKSINSSPFKSYKDWLEAKKKELVKINSKI